MSQTRDTLKSSVNLEDASGLNISKFDPKAFSPNIFGESYHCETEFTKYIKISYRDGEKKSRLLYLISWDSLEHCVMGLETFLIHSFAVRALNFFLGLLLMAFFIVIFHS